MYAGALRCPVGVNYYGATTATTTLTAGSSVSIPLSVDITSNLTVGQNIIIIDQSHSSSGAHKTSSEIQPIASMVSGASPSITVATLSNSYDTGALVGNVPQNCAISSTTTFGSTFYMTRNNDGSWSGATTNTATGDTTVVTSSLSGYNSPTGASSLNKGFFGGELDLPLYQTTAAYEGLSGFLIGVQMFAGAGVASLDYYADLPLVWKGLFGATNANGAIGPLVNAQNTLTTVGWVP